MPPPPWSEPSVPVTKAASERAFPSPGGPSTCMSTAPCRTGRTSARSRSIPSRSRSPEGIRSALSAPDLVPQITQQPASGRHDLEAGLTVWTGSFADGKLDTTQAQAVRADRHLEVDREAVLERRDLSEGGDG